MQIMTKSKLSYARQGTALAFPSGLFHRSVQADEHTMKLCLFLHDTVPIIDLYTSTRTIRKKGQEGQGYRVKQ